MEKRKVAVSSIAWQQYQEDDVANKLHELGASYIEVAPTKLWPDKVKNDPSLVNADEVEYFKNYWGERNIEPIAMQSMMFLRPDLRLFFKETSKQSQDYLEKFITLASKMGVGKMVFGSPKNRILNADMSYAENYKIAVNMFRKLGNFASKNNVIFCIEPNPEVYGCNFIINAKEGRQLVKDVNSEGFKLHLDAAGMTLAGDDIHSEIKDSKSVLKHFHISEPYLNPVIDDTNVKHSLIANVLKEINYDEFISIEMKPSADDSSNITNLENAFKLTDKYYFSS